MTIDFMRGMVLEWETINGPRRGTVRYDGRFVVDTGDGTAFPLRDLLGALSLKRIDDGALHRH